MPVALRYAARSDIGLGRYRNNQDSGYAGPRLIAVCDGMGGHAAGDVASSTALSRLIALDDEPAGADALSLLERAVADANAELRSLVEDQPDLRGMGTTITAMVLSGQKIALAHIGDSRCYLLHGGELTMLSHDHTFVQTLVDEGRITDEEATRHPQRSVITRVLTGDPGDTPDLSVRETAVGDRYVVCSDGLTAVLSDDTLAEVLAEHQDPSAAAQVLLDLALRAGAADNVTCIVAHVVDPARDDASTVPEVVGSAAVRGSVPAVTQAASPAARAAALTRPAPEPDDAPTVGPPASGRRRTLRAVATLVVLAVLGVAGYTAYSWSQSQYYVGVAGSDVAIYRGLPQDIGPISMSHLVERPGIGLASLPEYAAGQVRGKITVSSLAAARSKADELRSQTCSPSDGATPSTPTPSTTTPTTPTPTATTPATTGCGAP